MRSCELQLSWSWTWGMRPPMRAPTSRSPPASRTRAGVRSDASLRLRGGVPPRRRRGDADGRKLSGSRTRETGAASGPRPRPRALSGSHEPWRRRRRGRALRVAREPRRHRDRATRRYLSRVGCVRPGFLVRAVDDLRRGAPVTAPHFHRWSATPPAEMSGARRIATWINRGDEAAVIDLPARGPARESAVAPVALTKTEDGPEASYDDRVEILPVGPGALLEPSRGRRRRCKPSSRRRGLRLLKFGLAGTRRARCGRARRRPSRGSSRRRPRRPATPRTSACRSRAPRPWATWARRPSRRRSATRRARAPRACGRSTSPRVWRAAGAGGRTLRGAAVFEAGSRRRRGARRGIIPRGYRRSRGGAHRSGSADRGATLTFRGPRRSATRARRRSRPRAAAGPSSGWA